jgi:Ras-related protein Rab-5C
MTKKSGRFLFEIWDTAGQERYESITPLYYRSAQAAVITFDVNDKESFAKAKSWLTKLRKELDNSDMPIALAANKCDDDQAATEVDMDEAEAFAREHDMKLFRTSAKTGRNVSEMFDWLAVSLPAPPAPVSDVTSVHVSTARASRSAEEGCC